MKDSMFIQQHLANERTFLAWIRTAITIIGLGFLTSGIIFRSTAYLRWEHIVAIYVGIGSVLLASAILIMATKNYFSKRKDINTESFRSPTLIIVFAFAGLLLINLLLLLLITLILFF